jgi:hypothetical protein
MPEQQRLDRNRVELHRDAGGTWFLSLNSTRPQPLASLGGRPAELVEARFGCSPSQLARRLERALANRS